MQASASLAREPHGQQHMRRLLPAGGAGGAAGGVDRTPSSLSSSASADSVPKRMLLVLGSRGAPAPMTRANGTRASYARLQPIAQRRHRRQSLRPFHPREFAAPRPVPRSPAGSRCRRGGRAPDGRTAARAASGRLRTNSAPVPLGRMQLVPGERQQIHRQPAPDRPGVCPPPAPHRCGTARPWLRDRACLLNRKRTPVSLLAHIRLTSAVSPPTVCARRSRSSSPEALTGR